MKFVISTQELNYLISRCQGAVSQRMPLLSNVLLEATGGELQVSATDLNISIRCYTDAKVLEEGATTLPLRKLGDLAKALTSVNVTFQTNEKHVTEIIADSSLFKLNGMAPTNFPPFPILEGAHPVKVDQKLFRTLLQGTAFSAAKDRDDDRMELTGVLLRIANSQGCFIGTDAKRLARSFFPLEIDASFSGSYVIPIKAVDEILKNVGEEGEATLYLQKDKIALESESATVVCKLISAEYPNVDRVIPEKIENLLVLHREELITLLRQVALFSEGEYQNVSFTFREGELLLNANTTEVGEGSVSMPVDYRGPELKIAFNPHYVLDILKRQSTETVVFGINDPFNPGIISDEQNLKAFSKPIQLNPLYVVMPVCVSSSPSDDE